MRDVFVVPLPYGTRVDWLRNVLAARRATIDAQGKTYNVVEPVARPPVRRHSAAG